MAPVPYIPFEVHGIPFDMAVIPPGRFEMGEGQSLQPHRNRSRDFSGRPHPVSVTRSFLLAKTLVSQELWTAVMGNNPSFFRGPRKPVESISWTEAAEFLSRLSQHTGHHFRMPTEAEWEYACSLGMPVAFRSEMDRYAWFADNSQERTQDVGTKLPDQLGLYDMLGNVYQWCADWYGDYPRGQVEDPTGPSAGRERVYRGGAWSTQSLWLRPGFRLHARENYTSNTLGLRLAADPALA